MRSLKKNSGDLIKRNNIYFIHAIQSYTLGIVFVLLYLAEHIFPQRKNQGNREHDFKNFLVGALNLGVSFVAGFYFQKIIGWLNAHNYGLFNWFRLPFYFSLMLQLLLLDIYMYWWHRLNHVKSFFWRFHRFHHLDTEMNSTTALRFHTVELLLSYVFRLMIFPFFGFSLAAIVLYSLLFFPIVVLHHSNLFISEKTDKLLRKLFVSPLLHRIHHSNKMEETNSNYSSVFPWWDKLFKTYRNRPKERIQFGVDPSTGRYSGE